jgi:hypothetical protein
LPASRASGFQRISSRLRALLVQPRASGLIIAASLALCAPALATGLVLDDNFHAVALSGGPGFVGSKRAPWDGFAFGKNPAAIKQMIDEGVFPWWSDLHARLSFFRPLTSLTLWLDQRLWSGAAVVMHIHNLLWYALLLLVVSRVYRRFSSSGGVGFAGLALLIFAFDDARATSAGWLANRGSLLALGFGFAALLAHDSWRARRRFHALPLALGLLAVGLLCAEAAVQVLGYLIAYSLFVDRGSKCARWLSLAPYAVLVGAWRIAYRAFGYGAERTDVYIDPAADPIRFVHAALARLPVLITAQFGGVSADLGDILKYVSPAASALLTPVTVLLTAFVVWVFYPLWKLHREARFWTLGTALATIPVCATAPADRLLMATALGGSALVAMLVLGLIDRTKQLSSRARTYAAVPLVVANLVIAPLLLPVECYALVYLDRYIDRAERSIPSGSGISSKTVVLLNPPSDEYGLYMAYHRHVHGRTMPEHIRWLATSDNDLRITRTADNGLKIRPSHGFLPPGSLWTLRSHETHAHVGDRLDLQGVSFEVTEVAQDGRPSEVLVLFTTPLDSDNFVWLRWSTHGGFEPFQIPARGQTIWVPAVDVDSVLATLASNA